MWKEMDNKIRSRINADIVASARTRMIIYLLMLMTVGLVLFFVVKESNAGAIPPVMLFLLICFFGVGIMAVFYIYFAMIRERSALVNEASFMTLGSVVTKLQDKEGLKLIVKIPGDRGDYRIFCDPVFYKSAAVNSRVLIVAASKKNEKTMYGVEPSTYDKDGIL